MPLLAIKFKAYDQDFRLLVIQLEVACEIYNHCVLLHRRYYNIFHIFLSSARLQSHLTQLKKSNPHWKCLGSQAIQDIAQRIDKAYKRYFQEKKKGNKRIKPPGLKTCKSYKSFTLKQEAAGYQFERITNRIRIGKTNYKFIKHRDLPGKVKTLTVKKDDLGDFWFIASCEVEYSKLKSLSGTTVGCDLGLITNLVFSNKEIIKNPEFFKKSINLIKKLNRIRFDHKSSPKQVMRATFRLARVHKRIANKRRDWQFKLAKSLVSKYDVVCFETLDIELMKERWGEKYLITHLMNLFKLSAIWQINSKNTLYLLINIFLHRRCVIVVAVFSKNLT